MPIVDECIEKGVKIIWFRLEVVNHPDIEKNRKK